MSLSSEKEHPKVPLIQLAKGRVSASIFDVSESRPELGGRFVHGGYVYQLSIDGESRLGRPFPAWNPLQGQGLPDVFEWPLGWAHSKLGDRVLRIGTGLLERKSDDPYDMEHPLVYAAPWSIDRVDEGIIRMRSECSEKIGSVEYGYEIERAVVLQQTGLSIRTSLQIQCGWNTPIQWFSHPYFLKKNPNLNFSYGGREWSTRMQEGFESITQLYGEGEATKLRVSNLTGTESCIEISTALPLDHLVLFWTENVFSPEPQWVHTWKHNERLSWDLSYSFNPNDL